MGRGVEMHNSTARHAQSSSTRHARKRDYVERDGVDSRSGSTNSTADTGLGNPLDRLIEAGALFVGVLRAVPVKLQRRLQLIVNSSPTRMLDASTVQPSRWGGRHESAFRSKDFEELKQSIRHYRRNLQPVLVTQLPYGGYELVFGHRRHRACSELGLPVQALVWHGDASDQALIALQDAENRVRTNPSTLDQGRFYGALLRAAVFPSQRKLAAAFEISHTWVRKAITVAALPDEIIAAFDDPAQIQPAHAERIAQALNSPGCDDVLLRAAELAAQDVPRTPAQVLGRLLGPQADADGGLLTSGGQQLGSWKRDAKGRIVITLELAFSCPEMLRKIASFLGSLAATHGVET